MTTRSGSVYLVGAGPGDPGLITVRGLELLRRADVVLYDRLVSSALLAETPVRSQRVAVGKTPGRGENSQASINAALIRFAKQGKAVVRLKGGDPTIFGRGWEELDACRRAGVPCEIVPGVTSAIAAPAAAGIALTRRGVASSMAIVAGHDLSRRRLAAAAQADTSVFLMGVSILPALASGLIAAGRDAATPVAIVENGTLPDQRLLQGTLESIASLAKTAQIRPPAVIVVGPTAGSAHQAAGALSGKRLVVTRPPSAAQQLVSDLQRLGAHVVLAPTIAIALRDPGTTDVAARLAAADWLLFTSRHGVRGLRAALEQRGLDVRQLGHVRVGVVGPGTGRELATWGVAADVCATPARAEALVSQCLAHANRPRHVVHACGSLALDIVPARLKADGVVVDSLRVYCTTAAPLSDAAQRAIRAGIDGVLFASPSAVHGFGGTPVDIRTVPAICIGPTTGAAARALGWHRVHIAAAHSDSGLVAAAAATLGSPKRAEQ